MKILVIYDSKYGNTEKVAQTIAVALGNGVRLAKVDTVNKQDTIGLDILVVGSPTQMWQPTLAIKQFIEGIAPDALSGIKAAAFETAMRSRVAGSAAKKIERELFHRGCSIVASPGKFLVAGREGPLLYGELDRAAAWAKQILKPKAT